MSDERELLRHRLVGAAVVFAGFFLLSLLVPSPQHEVPPEGAVVISMQDEAAPASVTAPRVATAPRAAQRQAVRPPAPAPVVAPRPVPAPATPPPAPPAPTVETSPEAAPETAPPAAAPEAQGGSWWVQAASYSSEDAAVRGAGLLDDAGIRNRLREVVVDGRRIWRLQAGPFFREDEADMWRQQIEGKGFQGARVLRRDD